MTSSAKTLRALERAANWRREVELRVAWENGGGNAGALERLKFANDYLARHAAALKRKRTGRR